jgi:RHS repeat-associated protein
VNGSQLDASDVTKQYFYRDVEKTTTTGGLQVVNVAASSVDGSYATPLHFFIRPTMEDFSYDADGNLSSDGLWNYTYDAENQLVQMISKHPDKTGQRVGVRFVYDYQGRRVAKQVYDADPSGLPLFTSCRSQRQYLYDGWLLIAEYEVNPANENRALMRTYTWGPDLGGGDGIGGLLAMKDCRSMYAGVYQTAFDGNGNLVALVRAHTGELAASYEYDGFGNLLRAGGFYAGENPFRFSTKYHDVETGLLYYGLRYYSSSLGRFINQDPIRENGGLNLYSIANNDIINNTDYFGLNRTSPNDWGIDVNWDMVPDYWKYGGYVVNANSGNNSGYYFSSSSYYGLYNSYTAYSAYQAPRIVNERPTITENPLISQLKANLSFQIGVCWDTIKCADDWAKGWMKGAEDFVDSILKLPGNMRDLYNFLTSKEGWQFLKAVVTDPELRAELAAHYGEEFVTSLKALWEEATGSPEQMAKLLGEATFKVLSSAAVAGGTAKLTQFAVQYASKGIAGVRILVQDLRAAEKIPRVRGNPNTAPVYEKIVVDPKGNAIPLKPGEYITGSPDGRFIQVRDATGQPTGLRIDGPHKPASHPDPRAQVPHAHVPGVTNPDGTPWLPIRQ